MENSQTQLFETDERVFEKIPKLFGRTRESLEEDVAAIQGWLKSQRHLPEIMDSKSVRLFLIINKCSIERTKQKVDMYYTIRSLIPDMYENVNPALPMMQATMDKYAYAPLPQLTKEMNRVVIYKILKPELIDKLDPQNVLAHLFNCAEIRLKEDFMLKDVLVMDMDGINFGYISKCTPTLMAKSLAMYEKVYSMRMAAMYIVNCPSFFSSVVTIMKSLMKPKIFERVHVFQDSEILKAVIDEDILPTEYGGKGRSIEEQHKIMKLKLSEYQERFDQLDKMRVNENLRAEKLENDDNLGFHGNFKQLSLD